MFKIMEIASIVGGCLSFLVISYYYYYFVRYDDSFYFRVSLIFVLVGTFFIADSLLFSVNSKIFASIVTVLDWIWFLFELLFGKKLLYKEDYKWTTINLLEQYGINYGTFKKLSRKEQISILQNTKVLLEDGTMINLMEDDELPEYEVILNKK